MFRFLFDKDTWQELRESLTKNKLRTIITMIGVWWGILLLIGLLGSAKGIENKFSVDLNIKEPHLLFESSLHFEMPVWRLY